jgi:hypothetical protein
VSRGARHRRDWQERDRVQRMNAGRIQQRERITALLSARRTAEDPTPVKRPGISTPVAVRFASTSASTDWLTADRGQPITNAILDAVEDGHDRVVLAWPSRPGNGFAAAAIALREARASGRLAYGTLALWPWRSGATWSARSILVHPGDIAQMGQRAADEILNDAVWAKSGLAQKSLYMLELRLQDLMRNPGPSEIERRGVVVRSPTLLETTSVFPPARSAPYVSDGEQVLRRVRDYTYLGDRKAGLKVGIGAIGDPAVTPFAVFALPAAPRPEALSRYLEFPRLNGMLDAVVVDATRNGRAELADDWEQLLGFFCKRSPGSLAADRRSSRSPKTPSRSGKRVARSGRMARRCGRLGRHRKRSGLIFRSQGFWVLRPG